MMLTLDKLTIGDMLFFGRSNRYYGVLEKEGRLCICPKTIHRNKSLGDTILINGKRFLNLDRVGPPVFLTDKKLKSAKFYPDSRADCVEEIMQELINSGQLITRLRAALTEAYNAGAST